MTNTGQHQFDEERFLRLLEDPWYQLLVVLQDRVHTATAAHWSSQGAVNMMLPITTGSVSSPNGLGSDSAPVPIRIRQRDTYLADSMQFMLEYGCRFLGRSCYYVMPSFRDEDPDETHLSEFFHSEAEIIGDLDDVIVAVEGYLRAVVQALLAESDALDALAGGTEHLVAFGSTAVPRITFDDAVAALAGQPDMVRSAEAGGLRWRTLTRVGELELMRQHGGPVWVTHFDRMAVPFYQAVDATGTKALAADLLLGVGETAGCGQRHATGDQLREAAATHGIDVVEYAWYVTMKDRFPLQTAGFGVGVERLLAWVLDHDDVRDLQLVPRHPERSYAP